LANLAEQVRAAEAALKQSDARIEQAKSSVTSAGANLAKASKDLDRAQNLVTKGDVSKRTFDGAKAALRTAELNLEFTEVRTSVSGFVTNLRLRLGSQAVAKPELCAIFTPKMTQILS